MTAYMTNIVFFLFWRFSSPRIQELASRSPSQTLEDGKKKLHLFYYTSSTPYFSPKSAATVKKKTVEKMLLAQWDSSVAFPRRIS